MKARAEGAARAHQAAEPEEGGGFPCNDCHQLYKTPQGLAGHRRLAHSTSTSRQLEERRRALDEQSRAVASKERAAQQSAADVARIAETNRRREADLSQREEEVRAAGAIPENGRVRGVARQQIAALPEVTPQTILRIRGVDYRVNERGELIHLYWPKGLKTEFEDGQWFRFGGHAYRIHAGELRWVPPSKILARLLGEKE
jgi:hypothetical protein